MQENFETSNKTIDKLFGPGVSGNPIGRPKFLASYIRETTDNGRDMVDLMVTSIHGETVNEMKPKINDMTDAAGWLVYKGSGIPVAQIEARSINIGAGLAKMNNKKPPELLQAIRNQAEK